MRQFAESYTEGICETAVSQIPWGHKDLKGVLPTIEEIEAELEKKELSIETKEAELKRAQKKHSLLSI